MNHRILVTLSLTEADREYLLERTRGAELRFGMPATVTDADLAWANIVLGNINPPDRLVDHRGVRWLHCPNVGLDAYDSLRQKRPDLVVTNTQGVADHAVSEQALAMLLGLTRQVPMLVRAQDKRHWARQEVMNARPVTLAGKQAHLLGFGSIAQCLAGKLAGLGMTVTVFRRSAEGRHAAVHQFLALDQLATHVNEADVVVNLLPEKPGTKRIVSRSVIDAMQPSAYFVNMGRGATVDEEALIAALQEKRLAGAALDVFATEPLPATSPFWELPNVLLSPHVAGRFDREMRRQVEAFVERLAQFA